MHISRQPLDVKMHLYDLTGKDPESPKHKGVLEATSFKAELTNCNQKELGGKNLNVYLKSSIVGYGGFCLICFICCLYVI